MKVCGHVAFHNYSLPLYSWDHRDYIRAFPVPAILFIIEVGFGAIIIIIIIGPIIANLDGTCADDKALQTMSLMAA